MQAGVLLSAIVLSEVCNVSDLASQSCLGQFGRCAANVFRCAVYCPRRRPALNLPTAVLAKVAMCADCFNLQAGYLDKPNYYMQGGGRAVVRYQQSCMPYEHM